MKKYILTFSAAIVLAACTKTGMPEAEKLPADSKVELTFSADLVTSKTTLGSDWSVSWCENDELTVLWHGGSVSSRAVLQDNGRAVFKASVDEVAEYYAVYPSSVSAEVDGEGHLSIVLPDSFSGRFEDCAVIVAHTTRESLDFGRFKSAVALIRFCLDDNSISSVQFSSSDNAGVSGGLVLDRNLAEISREQFVTSVEVRTEGKGEYFFPVLPGQKLPGFTFRLSTSETLKSLAHSDRPFELSAGDILCINTPLDSKAETVGDFFITQTGSGRKDASSWADAGDASVLVSLLSSDDLSALNGHTINVAEGTYDLSSAGTALSLASASPATVTISGVPGKTIFTTTNSGEQGVILSVADENVTLELNGLTFSGASHDGYGGALYLTKGTHSIKDCVFSRNATVSSLADRTGGAAYIGGSASVDFRGCEFIENTTSITGGGALGFYSTALSTLTDCLFRANDGGKTGNGGAVLQKHKDNVLYLVNCSFDSNKCNMNGSDIFTSAGKALMLYNCTAVNQQNNAPATLGSIRANGPVLMANSTMVTEAAGATNGVFAIGISPQDAAKCVLVNNLVLCNSGRSFGTASTTTARRSVTSFGHNVYTGASENIVWTDNGNGTDKAGVKLSELFPSTALSANGILEWTGELEGFTKASASEVESAVKSFDFGGEDFYKWLYDNNLFNADARGVSRGESSWWPGAYQNR